MLPQVVRALAALRLREQAVRWLVRPVRVAQVVPRVVGPVEARIVQAALRVVPARSSKPVPLWPPERVEQELQLESVVPAARTGLLARTRKRPLTQGRLRTNKGEIFSSS